MAKPGKYQCVVETKVGPVDSPTLLLTNPADSGVNLEVVQGFVSAGPNDWGSSAPRSCITRLEGTPSASPIDAAPTVSIYQLDGLAGETAKAKVHTRLTHKIETSLPAVTYCCPIDLFAQMVLDGCLVVTPGNSVAVVACVDGGADGVAWVGIGWNETAV